MPLTLLRSSILKRSPEPGRGRRAEQGHAEIGYQYKDHDRHNALGDRNEDEPQNCNRRTQQDPALSSAEAVPGMVALGTGPRLNEDIDQVVPGHDEQGPGGCQPKTYDVWNCPAFVDQTLSELRVPGLQEKGNELVEDRPEAADPQKTKTQKQGPVPGEFLFCHAGLISIFSGSVRLYTGKNPLNNTSSRRFLDSRISITQTFGTFWVR